MESFRPSKARSRALGCCALLALAGVLAGQGTRLSGPLAAGPSQAGDVRAFALDPSGTWAAYLADQEVQDVVELYALPLDGSSAPVKLSGTLVAGGDVLDEGQPHFALAPAGERIVYMADADEDETFQLYGAPRDGSAPPVALGPALAGGDVHAFRISPDGALVVLLADVNETGSFDLYVTPTDGSTSAVLLAAGVASDESMPFELGAGVAVYLSAGVLHGVALDGSGAPYDLSGTIVAGGAVEGDPPFRLDPSGARVVFRADKSTDDVYELYSVPTDGSGSPVKLNGLLAAGVDVDTYQITPGGARVLYFAKALYSVPIQGGANPINIGLASLFEISPDSSRVVYVQTLGGGLFGVFSRGVTGGQPGVRLDTGGNVDPCAGGDSFAISPDSSRVAFLETDGELWGAPIDASAPRVQLSAGGVRACAAGGPFTGSLPVSADGRVLYLADPEADGVFELFGVPLDGSAAPSVLDGPLACGGEVEASSGLQPALAGGTEVVYLADQDLDDVREVYAVPADASQAPRRLNAPLIPDVESGDVSSFALAAGGAHAVYLADPDEDERLELFSVSTLEPGPPARLAGELALCGDVSVFRISPDGTRVVFLADRDTDGLVEVFVAPIDGSSGALKLSAPFGAGGGAEGSPYPSFPALEFTPDSSRVLFYARASASDPLVLHCAALDGSATVALGEASAFHLGPDGTVAVLIGAGGELYQVPCDGSGLPVSLSGALGPGVELLDAWLEPEFEVAPDGQRVVFAGDLLTDDAVELFSVPLDGSAAPVRISGNLVAGGDVRGFSASVPSFRITPDGQSVVCSADAFFDDQLELLRMPIDGSELWSQLNSALVLGGDVVEYALTPDGARVVYRADQVQNERFELFTRRADGIGSVQVLSGSLGPTRDVVGFQLAADSLRAVYQADGLANDMFELFSVPVDASAPALRISAPLPAWGDIPLSGGYRLGAGGAWAAYLADVTVDGRHELFRVPLARSAPPIRVNGDLSGGSIPLAPDGFAFGRGARVFYLADQLVAGVRELFAEPHRRRASGPPQKFITR